MITFSQWLRTSNEAQPFRDAFSINEKMPADFGLKLACFNAIQSSCEDAWEATKSQLSPDRPAEPSKFDAWWEKSA